MLVTGYAQRIAPLMERALQLHLDVCRVRTLASGMAERARALESELAELHALVRRDEEATRVARGEEVRQ